MSVWTAQPVQAWNEQADAAASRRATRHSLLDSVLTTTLLIAFLLLSFVGMSPLSEGSIEDRAGGGSSEQLVSLSFVLVALVICARNWRRSLGLVMRTWPVWLLLAWFLATMAWSDYPAITLRRSVAMIFVAITCFGIAVGSTSLYRPMTVIVAVLAFVIGLDFAAFILSPDFAITPIGVRGIHAQKNVAGLIALLSIVLTACWIIAQRKLHKIVVGATILLASFGFLLMTQSKTSTLLALMALTMIPVMIVGARFHLTIMLSSATTLALFAFLVIAAVIGFGFDIANTAEELGFDLSFTGRSELWAFVQGEIARRPFLGFGFGSFWDVGVYDDPLLRASGGSWLAEVETGAINQAHNGYLDLWVHAGLPGLIGGTGIIVIGLWTSLRVYFEPGVSGRDRSVGMALFLFFGILLAHNAFESSMWFRGQALAHLSLLFLFVAARLASTLDAKPAPLAGSVTHREYIPAGGTRWR